MLTLKPAHLTKPLDFSDVKRKKAFLGYITSKVREKAIAQIPDERGVLVDIATGNGLFPVDIQHRYHHSYKLIGLDLLYPLLKEAQQISKTNSIKKLEWINGDAFHLPIRTDSVSIIFCLNTFLNIKTFDEVKAILKELVRITIPGGKIVFDIRNRSNILIYMIYFLHSFQNTFTTSSYYVAQFNCIMEEVGTELINVDAVGLKIKLCAWDFIITLQKKK
ncbi:MAG: class I SAM-dependent methyltransferase [Candidatus Marinimicrobia bacterium]|nr:class I SAM-dependent methyltransferase [Candidatus Neomarinimicrobiota bacterium]